MVIIKINIYKINRGGCLLMKSEINGDIAGKGYWDNIWENARIPGIIDPRNKAPGNVIARAKNQFFHKIFDKYLLETKEKLFLEVGCGNSAHLPYMSKEFGFHVSGLDYSEIGCEMAKRTAIYYGVEADIRVCDLFEPAEDLLEKYDVVFAAGVIEHFKEISKPCEAMTRLVKPGGYVINTIPNFSLKSYMGKLQKKYAPDIYDKHVLLDKEDLIQAHEKAGLKMLYCDYLLAYDYGVLNFGGKHEKLRKYYIRKGKLQMLFRKNRIKGTRKHAPYIVYIGRKN